MVILPGSEVGLQIKVVDLTAVKSPLALGTKIALLEVHRPRERNAILIDSLADLHLNALLVEPFMGCGLDSCAVE